jgi:cytochrome P450
MMQEQLAVPPGPEQSELRARSKEIRYDPHPFFVDMAERYGDVVHWRGPRNHYYLLSHPDLVKDVLVTNAKKFDRSPGHAKLAQIFGQGVVTSTGEVHKRERRLLRPFFRHDQILSTFSVFMTEAVGDLVDRWEDGEVLDIQSEMMALTLRIIAKVLFDTVLDKEDALEFGEAMTKTWGVWQVPFDAKLQTLDTAEGRKFQEGTATMNAIIYRIIETRRAEGRDHQDMLSLLMGVRDEDGNPMPDLWLRDHVMSMLGAGHETTANGLTWILYLLSQNPEAAARVRAETDAVLQGRRPTAEDMALLPYTTMVMEEGWRLYPPVWLTERLTVTDHEVRGYTIPQGSIVWFSQYIVQRDARWFPDPERFDPERWTEEAVAARPRYTYFPFGGGNRICLGEFFARLETALVIAGLTQIWDFELVEGHSVDFYASMTLRPKHGMPMTVRRRRDRAA